MNCVTRETKVRLHGLLRLAAIAAALIAGALGASAQGDVQLTP